MAMHAIQLISTLGMDNSDWLEFRKRGIGGSDAAAILRLSTWTTPVDIFLEKTGKVESKDISDQPPVWWGSFLEDKIAEAYSIFTGNKVRRCNKMLSHPDYPWMLANLDRVVVGKDTILECKTAHAFTGDKWGEEGSDELPDQYLLQCMHYMIVTGYKKCDLAVLIGGSDFRLYSIDYDEEIAEMLIEEERKFWQDHVLAGVAPDPTNLGEVKALYAKDNGLGEEADSDTVTNILLYKKVKERLKLLEEEEASLKDEIAVAIGEKQFLHDPEGKKLVTLKASKTNRIDSTRLKKEQPLLAKAFTKTTNTRTMRFMK